MDDPSRDTIVCRMLQNSLARSATHFTSDRDHAIMTQREVLHVSLGASANDVSAHYWNLAGLAATEAYTDEYVTHQVLEETLVPRALFVDVPRPLHHPPNPPDAQSCVWSGRVETLDAFSRPPVEPDPTWRNLHASAASLACNPYSRYHKPRQQHVSVHTSNARHVDWDALEEEPDEDPAEKLARLERQRRQWHERTQAPMQDSFTQFWDTTINGLEIPASTMDEPSAKAPMVSVVPQWNDYLLPPYHPNSFSSLPPSFDNHSDLEWNTFWNGASDTGSLRQWKDEQFLERIRNMLEDCDSCQAIMISTSDHGVFAGLATSLMEDFKQECPAARRIVATVDDQIPIASPTYRSLHDTRFRQGIERAMSTSLFTEQAHAVLPLKLPEAPSRFHATAFVASALETSTLPFRLNSASRISKISLNSHYYGALAGDSPFGVASNLSVGEWVNCLCPSGKHNIIELDAYLPTTKRNSYLWDYFVEGTSIERDLRMRQGHLIGAQRPRDVDPGNWMRSTTQPGGLLTSLSPERNDRSHHHHFALAASSRCLDPAHSMTEMLDCILQGMGIQYRPEQSIAMLLEQTVSSLTEDGYAAGSYWRRLLSNQPTLAVLGNTTRSYRQLVTVTDDAKISLSNRYQGLLNRDITQDRLPEREDLQEALSACYNLRDLYQPPEGSGLVVNYDNPELD